MNLRVGFGLTLLLACAREIDAVEKRPQDFDPEKALISKPFVQYPYEARVLHAQGAGIIVVEIDSATGKPTRVYMGVSTGYTVLDDAAVRAFEDARFKPGTPPRVKVPIAFTLSNGRGYTSYDVKKKSMDDVLARYLGKGTVLQGPIPEYPRYKDWTFKEGKGVYELHANATGNVDEVKILKSSGDPSFDGACERTLRKWRLRRGPLVLELPLSFSLTPVSFSVQVAR